MAPEEDPTYSIQLKYGTLVHLKLQQMGSLAIPPPSPTQSPPDDVDVPAWLRDGNAVSYEKDGVCLKCKINKLPQGVYRLS